MKSSFLKDLFSVFVSRITVIIFGVGTSVLTAHYLGPEGSGTIAALMVYPALFMTIGSLGISQATIYFVGQNKYSINVIYSSVMMIFLITSLFSVTSCYLLIKFFTKGTYSNLLITLAIVAVPFSLYTTYASGMFLGRQNIKEYNRINWVPGAIGLVFTALLVAAFPLGVEGSMIANFLGVFILFIFVVLKVRRFASFTNEYSWTVMKQMLRLGIVYAVSLMIISLNYKVDVVLLEKMSTTKEIGIYSRGVILVEYLWQIPTLLSTLVFSRSAGSKDPINFSYKVCRLLRLTGAVILLASVVLYFMAGFVINLLYGERFADSTMVLKILMPGVLLHTIFRVLNMDMAGKGKPWLSMKAMLPAVIVNIILNYLWIPKYGANGSAMASTVSYTLSALIFLWVYSKETGIRMIDIVKFTKEDREFVMNYYTAFRNRVPAKAAVPTNVPVTKSEVDQPLS